MKRLLIILLCIPVLAFAQGKTYIIQGKIGSHSAPAKMYLMFIKPAGRIVDSALVNDGQFKFSGIADSISKAYLFLNIKGDGPKGFDNTEIYIEPGTIKVNSADSLIHATIGGTRTNDDNSRFKKAIQVVYDEWNALDLKKSKVAPDVQKSDTFVKAYDKESAAIKEHYFAIEADFAKNNPGSYLSLRLLLDLADNVDYSIVAPLAQNLSPALKNTLHGRELFAILPALKATMTGSMAPEFSIPDTGGKILSLSSLRGKYVLIDFWASWCGPCRGENPNLVKAFGQYKTKNFTVLGVSFDDKKDDWLKAIIKDGLTWPQVCDLQGMQGNMAKLYAVKAIPKTFLIDPEGKIIAVGLRGDEVENKLAELFGSPVIGSLGK